MDYFEDMKLVSDKVDKVIEDIILNDRYIEFNLNSVFKKRKGAAKMRPYLTQIAFEYCDGKNHISHISTLSEINNLHLYLDNWIFDNKHNVWDNKTNKRMISEITINSQIFEKLTGDLISSLKLQPEIELLIRKKFDNQIIACYKGQHQDLKTNLGSMNKFKTDKDFLSFYINRCALLSGEAYGLSAWLGGITTGAPEETLDRLYAFGRHLGIGIHMSNDLGDFGLFNTNATLKSYQDQMADLTNGRLTLPIYYVLKYGSSEQKKFFLEKSGNKLNDSEKSIALNILIESGAFDYCYDIIKMYCKKTKKYVHTNFCKNDARDKMSNMTSTIRTNKYLRAIKTQQKRVLKTNHTSKT